MTKFYLLIFALLYTSCSTSLLIPNCNQYKLTFDVGSGSTKYYYAQVNQCTKSITKMIKNDSFPFPFKKILSQSKDNAFPESSQKIFITKLNNIISTLRPTIIRGVATSAFRTAANGAEFAKVIGQKTKMDLRIITQRQEGLLGYNALKKKLELKTPILYWDIGGASMQMVKEEGGSSHLYEGKIGAVSFKDLINREILHKQTNSPNPIRVKNIAKVVKKAKQFASRTLSLLFKNHPSELKVIGVGGVHQYAILKNNKNSGNAYTLKELKSWLVNKSKLSDKQLGGKYAATDVTNMALVAGYMELLGIKKVTVASNINMAYALLYQW